MYLKLVVTNTFVTLQSSNWQRYCSNQKPFLNSFGKLSLLKHTYLPLFTLLILYLVGHSNSLVVQSSDPKPTIYSGDVSFALLLSAHAPGSSELMSAATNDYTTSTHPSTIHTSTQQNSGQSLPLTTPLSLSSSQPLLQTTLPSQPIDISTTSPSTHPPLPDPSLHSVISKKAVVAVAKRAKRQIFERGHRSSSSSSSGPSSSSSSPSQNIESSSQKGICSLIQPSSLYAGMAAIWSSHQANLVGDSSLNVGSYIYDSCSDLDVAQRQAVRIVSNLNSFQQTTCEAPRGSPISLAIVHGDNQLRAIQLLTSFKVPVIATRDLFEFANEVQALSRPQRAYLFSTAPSMRYLAFGSLRFTRKVVLKAMSSSKLANKRSHGSRRNGLVVISKNLPSKFILFLADLIPSYANYELIQSNNPIDQIKSVQALERILMPEKKSDAVTQVLSSSSPIASVTSKQAKRIAKHPRTTGNKKSRVKRGSEPDTDSFNGSDILADDLSSMSDDLNDPPVDSNKMLSPTIVMFITMAEVIDLMTRLRNDLAEVSKYYSLVVATNEDITQPLKTIFRGGSTLCAGKSLYIISPRPDDLIEFSRYFRDAASIEGDTSDHPLIVEYAKFQSSSRRSFVDMDDASAEPVVKAVWTAASAFKTIHKQHCAGMLVNSNTGRSTGELSNNQNLSSNSSKSSSSSASKSAYQICMAKLHKNLAVLTRSAIKKLDVTINSTGLMSLDGFRLKFDEMNELETNKFSIKHINKECEITELGIFSGLNNSSLQLDEESLDKALEMTLPEPWPLDSGPVKIIGDKEKVKETTASPSTKFDSSLEPNTSSNENSESTADDNDNKDKESESSEQSPSAKKYDSDNHSSNYETSDGANNSDEPNNDGEGSENIMSRAKQVRESSNKNKTSSRVAATATSANKRDKIPKGARSPLTASPGSGVTDVLGPSLTFPKQQDLMSKSINSEEDHEKSETVSEPTNSSLLNQKILFTESKLKYKPLFSTQLFTSAPNSLNQDHHTVSTSTTLSPKPINSHSLSHQNDEDPIDSDLKSKATTQSPKFVLPVGLTNGANITNAYKQQNPHVFMLNVAASTESPSYPGHFSDASGKFSSFSSTPSVVTGLDATSDPSHLINNNNHSPGSTSSLPHLPSTIDTSDYSSTIDSLPTSTTARYPDELFSSHQSASFSHQNHKHHSPRNLHLTQSRDVSIKDNHIKYRTHLKWVYSSWFAVSIMIANVSGALLTIYILTYLLMKNCDRSLNTQNQGLRSIHLLAIIVTFFGSTLFIIYPTPSLCLLRTSWHNFALVFLFGSLLLHCMELQSTESLGLGGRPNKLNQFLTLLFMVGVQVSFELQRWRYESPNYIDFVNTYLGSNSSGIGSQTDSLDKKLLLLTLNTANNIDPLSHNSLNGEHISPISLSISEHYQSLLQEYCILPADEVIQSQIYICIIVALLSVYSIFGKVQNIRSNSKSVNNANRTKYQSRRDHQSLVTGKMVADQHEANLNIDSALSVNYSTSHLVPQNRPMHHRPKNLFIVAVFSVPIFCVSVVLKVLSSDSIHPDVVSSVSLVSVAFVVLVTVFFPIIHKLRKYPKNFLPDHRNYSNATLGGSAASTNAMLNMFPELARNMPFASDVTNNMSSDGDSSGAGSRKAFAETKKCRDKVGEVLAHIEPSADSLRDMGLVEGDSIGPAELNLKLNMLGDNNQLMRGTAHNNGHIHHNQQSKHHRRSTSNANPSTNRFSSSDADGLRKTRKKLIMLDVDPRCPKHGCTSCKR